MTNNKYEITDIAHEEYPWLHRIRALRQIREDVKPGDLGGFVEKEANLDYSPEDSSWVYDESIICDNAYVTGDSIVRGCSIAQGSAYIAKNSVVEIGSVVMEYGDVQNGHLIEYAVVAGNGMVIGRDSHVPVISDQACVYGLVVGNVLVDGRQSVIFEGEEVCQTSKDGIRIKNGRRSVQWQQNPRELRKQPTERQAHHDTSGRER